MTQHRNIIIVGSGPAGYTAALYAARADLHPLVFEGVQYGGALMNTTEVENFPGFTDGIVGPDLMHNIRAQAERFGAELVADDVTSVELTGPVKTVRTLDGEWTADAVVLAMGSAYKKLGVAREDELSGHGVSWCATCDGFFFRGKDIAVVGGGDTAMEEATFLSRFASSVTVVHRRDSLRASKFMVERAANDPKIRWAWNSEVAAIGGDTWSTASPCATPSPAPPGPWTSPGCSSRSVTTRAATSSAGRSISTTRATCSRTTARTRTSTGSSPPATSSTTPTARPSPPPVRVARRPWTPSATSPPWPRARAPCVATEESELVANA